MKLLVAAAIALSGPAFPPPKAIVVTADTVCAWGRVTAVNGQSEIVVKTDAGPFTVRISGSTKLIGLDGKELEDTAALAKVSVRVYYVVDHGAKAREIDVIPTVAGETP